MKPKTHYRASFFFFLITLQKLTEQVSGSTQKSPQFGQGYRQKACPVHYTAIDRHSEMGFGTSSNIQEKKTLHLRILEVTRYHSITKLNLGHWSIRARQMQTRLNGIHLWWTAPEVAPSILTSWCSSPALDSSQNFLLSV